MGRQKTEGRRQEAGSRSGRRVSAKLLASYVRPDIFINSIYEIDPNWLSVRQIDGLVLDIDNTLLPRNAASPDDRLVKWVSELRLAGVKLVVLSNNWSRRVKKIARRLELPLLAPAVKPLGTGFKRAQVLLGIDRANTAMVGDQLFTDILGGNRAGMRTILVPPISPVDLIHTKLLRVFERLLLGRLSGRMLIDGRWREV